MTDNPIGGIQGISQGKLIQEAAPAQKLEPKARAFKPEAAEKPALGDRVHFSDDVKEPEHASSLNIDALKGNIADIKQKIGAKPSGQDATATLVNDAWAVQMEKSGLNRTKARDEGLGLTPGMNQGSTLTSSGAIDSKDPGMAPGGVFSSRRSSPGVHQPGGGVTSTGMVKMETDYAQALKKGDSIAPQAEDMVLQNLASQGAGTKPIASLLGLS
jgi:hypothetical protein